MTQAIQILEAEESLNRAKQGDLLIAPEANGLVLVWRIGDGHAFELVCVASSIAAALALIEAGVSAPTTGLRAPKPRRPTPLETGVKSVVATRLREMHCHMRPRQLRQDGWASTLGTHESGKEQDSRDTSWKWYLRRHGNGSGRH